MALFPLISFSVVQGYHELYELHRSRLETQLLHMMEERDSWIQLTFSLAKKVLHLNCFLKFVDFCVGFHSGCFYVKQNNNCFLKMK